MPASVDLIIFDCDGVLVDSEPLAMRVLLSAIEAQGIAVETGDAFRDYLGRSLASISQSLHDSHGKPLGEAALESMRHDLYALYREELRPSPWIAETLRRLDVPFCVASSSSEERIRFSLELAGLLPFFGSRIFSAAMVENGKPAPDLFLHVARAMGTPPENCLVVEDSPAGIRAARAAGMQVVAYLGGGHIKASGLGREIASLAPDARFDDMRCLPPHLALRQARARGEPVRLLAAVDVGTLSARAGIFTGTGGMLSRAEAPFGMRRPDGDIAEYCSEEIWAAACLAVREAMALSGADPAEVAAISFDATCSLVVRDSEGAPVTVSLTGDARWDTMSWMDHRAQAEAAEATATGHPVLDELGGVMSPEMQIPKLMWLKRRLPQSWERAGLFFDLSDFLCWKASGSLARSQCTLTCKWTYLPRAGGWQRDFLSRVGLDDLLERGSLPEYATPVGAAIGRLTPEAAAGLGLTESCSVGMGLVDAHAGTLGTVGCHAEAAAAGGHLALVGGTSNCVMALSSDPRAIRGVWGPFADAILPGIWLNDAGQSAAGALLDYIIESHAAGGAPTSEMHAAIVLRIAELRQAEGDAFASRLHVLPDFHGNRSPLGDPRALGVISGLSLDQSFDGLCRLYYRAAVGIALGVRHILETLREHSYETRLLHVVGGHVHNPLLMELYSDATGATLLEPDAIDATLLGVAMAAATAAGLHADLHEAAARMSPARRERRPNAARRAPLDADYRIFVRMLEQRRAIDTNAGAAARDG